ncbi:class I SAM-dependent methyltransferase [Paracoccaceae bacterium]|nr:class I SAM-dependent methyltransferase [Paracoccaceae bacterium]
MRNKPSLQNAYDLKSPDDNIKLYSVWAETYDISFIDEMQYKLHFAVAEEFVLNGGQGLILDVGAGTGAVAEALLQKAKFCIEATDISEEMLKVADSKNIYKRSFFSDLTKEIPVTNSSYDGVVSSGTFTHGHVGPSSISELVRITKPGGLITISINEKHWISLNFESEVEKLNQYTRNYTLKKISIYGEQSKHDHKDDKAVILTIKV